MFNKNKFAEIIKKISETYESQRKFAIVSDINRTYLSQYMNMKLNKPPKPETLEKIANASNGIVTYKELMLICNYIDDELDKISGESIQIFSNPYIDKTKCTTSENYIYNIIYTYEILESTNYNDIEKNKIIDSYNYIKNDKDYCKYISKHQEAKKQYCDDVMNEFDADLLKIGLSLKDYNPPTPEQEKQIEEFAKYVLKDNKKEN